MTLNPNTYFCLPMFSSLVETNQKEWIELPAVFVMKLKQALPISRNTLKQIQSATGCYLIFAHVTEI